MKKVILYNIIIGILLVTMSGCSFKSSNSAHVMVSSVEGSTSGNKMICKNSQNTYMCDGDGIYVHNGGAKEIIVEQEEISVIGCTERYVYYRTLSSELYRYSIESGETELLLKPAGIAYIKSDIDAIFIVTSKSTGGIYYYGVVLYKDNGEVYDMLDIVKESEVIESQDQFDIYDIDEYKVAVDNSIGSQGNPEIAYIWNDSFEFSCNPNNTYLEYNNQVYCIDKYLSQVVSLDDSCHGGIYSDHVYISGSKIYFIAQFSMGRQYRSNPANEFQIFDYYCCYDVESGEFEAIYKTELSKHIVGIAPDEGYILLLSGNKLIQYYYEDDIKNQIYELGEGCYLAYFEYFDGQTYIWEAYDNDYDSRTLSTVLDI
jgi:hypothetical protein